MTRMKYVEYNRFTECDEYMLIKVFSVFVRMLARQLSLLGPHFSVETLY